MLSLKNVEYSILKDKIVRDFSLNLQLGEVKTLFGPSGCGKTTILRLLSGLEECERGEISSNFAKISFLFQENRLLDYLRADENIKICMPKHAKFDEIYTLGEKLGLAKSDLRKFPGELSGGMAKRVAFMRAYLCGADLMLLDEPFVGLDRDMRDILASLLAQKIDEKKLSALLVTHDRFEAARLSHEILFLSKKGMDITKRISLDENLQSRDSAYEEMVVKRHFEGIMYYE
ncbi:MAG: ATP-binding cassette domain-containing protein [Campylobacter sp.]|nr:ATP-binding cassette domain-containing protein [Campylobacter sp.]